MTRGRYPLLKKEYRFKDVFKDLRKLGLKVPHLERKYLTTKERRGLELKR